MRDKKLGGQLLSSKKGISDVGHAAVADFRRNLSTPQVQNREASQAMPQTQMGKETSLFLGLPEALKQGLWNSLTPTVRFVPTGHSEKRVNQTLSLQLPPLISPNLKTFSSARKSTAHRKNQMVIIMALNHSVIFH